MPAPVRTGLRSLRLRAYAPRRRPCARRRRARQAVMRGAVFCPAMAGMERVVVLVNDLSIHGRMRLQKYAFLASEMYRDDLDRFGLYQDWRPHNCGPYSRALDLDVRRCVESGILGERTRPVSGGRSYCMYALEPKGLAILRRLDLEHGPMLKTLRAKLSGLDKKPWPSLLGDICNARPEYAASIMTTDAVAGISGGTYDDYDYDYEPNLDPEIEQALADIGQGRFDSKTYTVVEYIRHVQKVLAE